MCPHTGARSFSKRKSWVSAARSPPATCSCYRDEGQLIFKVGLSPKRRATSFYKAWQHLLGWGT
eukprot:2474398-Pyramimonas_sp.AAC.1